MEISIHLTKGKNYYFMTMFNMFQCREREEKTGGQPSAVRIRMMISELNALRFGGAGYFFVFTCLFVLMEERREMAWT